MKEFQIDSPEHSKKIQKKVIEYLGILSDWEYDLYILVHILALIDKNSYDNKSWLNLKLNWLEQVIR